MRSINRMFNRDETLINSASVSIVRYIERLFYFDNSTSHAKKLGTVGAKTKHFKNIEFRQHAENIEEIIAPAMQRYAEELFDYLAEEMFHAGHLKKEGNNLVAIPLNEYQKKKWLERKLAQWKTSLF